VASRPENDTGYLDHFIDDSKERRKRNGDMENEIPCPWPAPWLHNRLRQPPEVNENDRASSMNGEVDE
jgi:hypothetical protein